MQPSFTRVPHHPLVRSFLKTTQRSPRDYRLAQELVWKWVRARWPRLVPPSVPRENMAFTLELAGQALSSSITPDNACWTLEVTHLESGSDRVWKTQAVTSHDEHVDTLALQTSCSGGDGTPAVVAAPKLLSDWIDRLELEDGGAPVDGLPLLVSHPAELDTFWTHVVCASRALPIVALTCRRNSRYYGIDPRNLAQALRGIAHVKCFTAETAQRAAGKFGKGAAPVAGALRVYPAAWDETSQPPVIPIPGSCGHEPGQVRKQLCREICAIGVASPVGLEKIKL